MTILLGLLLLSQLGLPAQSPFDGTWVIDSKTMQLPQKPTVFLLAKGMFDWDGIQVRADGSDHKIPGTSYWDTVSVRIVDNHTVEVVRKKGGKPMFTEIDRVSADEATLTQEVKDTTEAEAASIETVSKRVAQGPPGSHPLHKPR